MRQYGEVAVAAASLARGGVTPTEAWEEATRIIFSHSKSLQDKGCPKSTFLGLCEDGFVEGVPTGSYTSSRDNKRYGIRAVELLVADPALADADPKVLWELVMNGQTKAHNSQMDVVLALWQRVLLSRNKSSLL